MNDRLLTVQETADQLSFKPSLALSPHTTEGGHWNEQ
jgi:hypothetical protein